MASSQAWRWAIGAPVMIIVLLLALSMVTDREDFAGTDELLQSLIAHGTTATNQKHAFSGKSVSTPAKKNSVKLSGTDGKRESVKNVDSEHSKTVQKLNSKSVVSSKTAEHLPSEQSSQAHAIKQQKHQAKLQEEEKVHVMKCAKQITGDDTPRKLPPEVRDKVLECAKLFMPPVHTKELLRDSAAKLLASATTEQEKQDAKAVVEQTTSETEEPAQHNSASDVVKSTETQQKPVAQKTPEESSKNR